MDEFYAKLQGHFANEASEDVHLEMAAFKEKDPDAYLMYQELWKQDKNFKVKDYNSLAAWNTLQNKGKTKPRRSLTWISKVAAVLLIGCLSAVVYYQNRKSDAPQYSQIHQYEELSNIVLADGSEVTLDKKAALEYPAEFSETRRSVKFQGEAFFSIAKDPTRPFVIETDNASTTVLGTSFNVNTTDQKTMIAVVSGRVHVRSKAGDERILEKGESLLVAESTFEYKKIENENFLAWKTGVFSFEQQPLNEVINHLNTYYNDSLTLVKGLDNCLLSADFNKAQLKDVVEVLELTCNAQIQIKK